MDDEKSIVVYVMENNQSDPSGLRAALQQQPRIRLMTEVEGDAEMITAITEGGADIVLIDADYAGFESVQICHRLSQLARALPVLFLTGIDRPVMALDAMKAGANGCLSKTTSIEVLISAMECIINGGIVWMPSILHGPNKTFQTVNRLSPLLHAGLTPIEEMISTHVADGKTNKEIGSIMGKAEKTVRNQLSKLMAKLRITRRSQLAALYAQKIVVTD